MRGTRASRAKRGETQYFDWSCYGAKNWLYQSTIMVRPDWQINEEYKKCIRRRP